MDALLSYLPGLQSLGEDALDNFFSAQPVPKRRAASHANPAYMTLAQLTAFDKKLRRFLRDHNKLELNTEPLAKGTRRQVARLLALYGLSYDTVGPARGNRQAMMILKSPATASPLPDSAELLGSLSQERIAAGHSELNVPKPSKRRRGSGRDPTSGPESPQARLPTRPAEGELVGADAAPIGTESVGSRLLLSMGWAPGSGIGRNSDGIAEPIQAVFRSSKKGLGFS